MSLARQRGWSLRRRVLVLLAGATLGMWILGAATIYADARRESQELFDQSLAETAHLLITLAAHEVEESRLSGVAPFVERADDTHSHYLFFQIWSSGGRLLYRTNATPTEPFVSDVKEGFSWALIRGQQWRTYAVSDPSGRLQIQIGQPLTHRREISSQIAWRLSVFASIFLPLLMALIWILTNRAFAPVRRSALEIAQRSAGDLREVEERAAPDEVRPLLSALNRMFLRVRAEMDRERRFTADAAHELRTPLAAIRAHLQVLEHARSDSEAAEAVADLHAGVDRSSNLIDQLLVLAKVDAEETMRAAFAAVELSELVAEEVGAHRAAAAGKEILLEIAAARVCVAGNRQMLALLLRNLIDNAIRYTPVGGTVRVTCGLEGATPRLSVVDNGAGIAPADRERVFARFVRAAGDDAVGSGLGLSIARRIVEQHDARITLGEGPDGRGLAVLVEFPAIC